jgi:hypothetical protein
LTHTTATFNQPYKFMRQPWYLIVRRPGLEPRAVALWVVAGQGHDEVAWTAVGASGGAGDVGVAAVRSKPIAVLRRMAITAGPVPVRLGVGKMRCRRGWSR